MRWGLLGALLVLALVGCDAEPAVDGADPAPTEPASAPVRVTAAALLAIAEDHLDATPIDVEAERLRPPECPASYYRLSAGGTFDGRRLWIQIEFGKCPRGSRAHFACGRLPDLPGREIELDACTGRTVADGSSLVAGRHDVYQESSSLLAVKSAADHEVSVGTSALPVPEFTVHELGDIATAPELGPRVDPAYVTRGRELMAD